MTLTRHEDLSLEYVVYAPPGRREDEELPLVVILHGRGADAYDLADLAPMMGADYRFVFPNAPKAFEPYPGMAFGWTWFDGWPAERGSLVRSRELILRFLDEITTRHPTPAGKLILGGFSQGALMSLDCGFRTPQPLAGIVMMSGALYEDDLPPFRPLPVLIVHGTADDVIPVMAARRARLVLSDRGVDPEYHEFGMGHAVSEESMAVVRDFLARCFANEQR